MQPVDVNRSVAASGDGSFSPGPAHLERVRAYYDATWFDYSFIWLTRRNLSIHFGYWDEHTRSHNESVLNLNRRLAQELGIQAGQRILDAGCGVGGSAIWLAKTYGVEVVGITPVASQVQRARQFAREQGVADLVTFEQQDYASTGFPAASFDVVWAIESVCHAPEKDRFFAEARRLLRSGGWLGMTEYLLAPTPRTAADDAMLECWCRGWAMPHLATAQQIQEWTGQAGFSSLQIQDITPNVRPSLRHLNRMCRLCEPGAWLLHRLGLRSATAQGNLHGSLAQYQALERDLWFYSVIKAQAAPA